MDQLQKDRIVEQAMQMFVTQGIKSVRMDDIAAQLGVSKRTLYETFHDKEELLYLSLRCYYQRDRARWDVLAAGAGNVLEAMFMVLSEVMDSSEVTSRMMDNLRKFYPVVYEKLILVDREEHHVCFREMLEQGIADGLFIGGVNIDLAIALLHETATALVTRGELLIPTGMSEREAFVQVTSTFFRGISTIKGVSLVDDYLKRYDLARHRE